MSFRAPLRHCAQGQHLLSSRVTYSPSSTLFHQRRIPSKARWARKYSRQPDHSNVQRSESPQLNPPRTTRAPDLTLPNRAAYESQFKYLFALGKAYLTFLKDGFKSVNANRKLLRQKLDRTPKDDYPSIFKPSYAPRTFSRADWVLLWRTRHDLIRLPAFGLVVLVFGEFSVIVIALIEGLVPYPCRIPSQVFHSQERAEARRKLAFEQLEARAPQGALSTDLSKHTARNHVLRSLYISGDMWERLRIIPPGMWQIKGELRMRFLEGDDNNIIRDGGVTGLIHEELKAACVDRGINILGKSERDLRTALGDWLRLTAAEDMTERRRRMTTLMLTRYVINTLGFVEIILIIRHRQDNWPLSRDFPLPGWHL